MGSGVVGWRVGSGVGVRTAGGWEESGVRVGFVEGEAEEDCLG